MTQATDRRVVELGTRILDEFTREIREAWDGFTDYDRQLIKRCSQRAAKLTLDQVAFDRRDDAAWADVKAQLANIAAAAELEIERRFFNAVARAFGVAASFITGVLKGLVT